MTPTLIKERNSLDSKVSKYSTNHILNKDGEETGIEEADVPGVGGIEFAILDDNPKEFWLISMDGDYERLISTAAEVAQDRGCYRISAQVEPEEVEFYKGEGFFISRGKNQDGSPHYFSTATKYVR